MLYFSKWKISLVAAICFLAIIFAVPNFINNNSILYKFLPKDKVSLGLDLRGGSHLLLQIDFDFYLKEQLSNLRDDLKKEFREKRVRALPVIRGDKVTFSLQNSKIIDEAKRTIKDVSQDVSIEENKGKFEIFFSDQRIIKIRQNVMAQSIEIVRRRVDESGTKEPIIQAQGNNRILLQVPGVDNPDDIKALLGKTAKMTFHFVVENTFNEYQGSDVMSLKDGDGRTIFVKREVILSGDLLIDANPTYHESLPAVAFRFNQVGTRKFAEITKNNTGRIFAIVLDGEVVTAPRIKDTIAGGSGVISGSFTVQQANDVALLLRAGALPAPLSVIEERTVGPSLGSDSIRYGAMASVMGLILVAISMIFFYRLFGLIANLALIINIALILTALSLIGATLTLPGIAGIVLTIGMAVDANVLIFERIKEEVRGNRNFIVAIDSGFSQAFRTIFDSNITTLIVAIFLYMFGNGPVRGFAVTLSIGILASMFSAIMLTRMMIALWIKYKRPQKLPI